MASDRTHLPPNVRWLQRSSAVILPRSAPPSNIDHGMPPQKQASAAHQRVDYGVRRPSIVQTWHGTASFGIEGERRNGVSNRVKWIPEICIAE